MAELCSMTAHMAYLGILYSLHSVSSFHPVNNCALVGTCIVMSTWHTDDYYSAIEIDIYRVKYIEILDNTLKTNIFMVNNYLITQ